MLTNKFTLGDAAFAVRDFVYPRRRRCPFGGIIFSRELGGFIEFSGDGDASSESSNFHLIQQQFVSWLGLSFGARVAHVGIQFFQRWQCLFGNFGSQTASPTLQGRSRPGKVATCSGEIVCDSLTGAFGWVGRVGFDLAGVGLYPPDAGSPGSVFFLIAFMAFFQVFLSMIPRWGVRGFCFS